MTGRFEFIFNSGQLDNLPAVYYGSARVRPPDVAALVRVVYKAFPTVTVVNVADVMQIVEDVVQRIAAVIALPADARSGDVEDAGRHAAAHRVDLLGGVPGLGNGGGIDGQPAGRRLRGAGAETAFENRFPPGPADSHRSRAPGGAGGDGGRMGGQFPCSGP